jgi:hypothetical protein
VFRCIQTIHRGIASSSSRRRPGSICAIGTGRSLSSGRPKAGTVGRCDGIFDVSIGTPSPDESCEWVETLEAAGFADLSTDILDETGEFIHARAYPAGSYDGRTPLMHEIRTGGIDL